MAVPDVGWAELWWLLWFMVVGRAINGCYGFLWVCV